MPEDMTTYQSQQQQQQRELRQILNQRNDHQSFYYIPSQDMLRIFHCFLCIVYKNLRKL
jgi:hypothetical protein